MEEASGLEAVRIALEQSLVPLLRGVGSATLQWTVFAVFFVPLFIWIIRAAKSRRAALIWVIVVGLIFLAAVGITDFWKSFGEAFAGGMNHYRRPTWISLTLTSTIVAVIGAYRGKLARRREHA